MTSVHQLLLVLYILCGACMARAEDVSVAVAANFSAPMQKIAKAFEQETGHKLNLALGSTGKFYAQIKNGAPYQLLLAADDETPLKLEQEGFAKPGSRWTYAMGRLVLWSKTPGLVDKRGDILRAPRFERLAIADPRIAPYGAAAVEVLNHLGLFTLLQPRLVQGESIGQAYQFVASSNATMGFVALSQVSVDGRIAEGSAWVVPKTLHTTIRQDAVVLVKGQDSPAVKELIKYLRSEKVLTLIQSHGYEIK